MEKIGKGKMLTSVANRHNPASGGRQTLKIGRNESCPCGSGKKYKECHAAEGNVFLRKLAQRLESERIKEERKRMKAEGVPWFRRMLT
jgi:hypothetical protein